MLQLLSLLGILGEATWRLDQLLLLVLLLFRVRVVVGLIYVTDDWSFLLLVGMNLGWNLDLERILSICRLEFCCGIYARLGKVQSRNLSFASFLVS